MRNRYLVRRGDAFYFRMAVPADLQQHFRQREIVKALGTSDKRVAVPAALAIASRVLQGFHEVRCNMAKANRVELMVLFDWRPDGSKTIKFDDVQPGDVETVQKLAREFAADTPQSAAPVPAPKKDATPTLSEAVKQFLAREAKGDKVAMLRKHESVLPVFVELVGDVRLSELKHARDDRRAVSTRQRSREGSRR